jgi:hypothetical protein
MLKDYAYGDEAAEIMGVSRVSTVWLTIKRHHQQYTATGRVIEVHQLGVKKLVLRSQLLDFAAWYRGRKKPKANTPLRGRRKTKLSPEQTQWIREQLAEGAFTQRQLAKMFGVSQPNISTIWRGFNWKSTGGKRKEECLADYAYGREVTRIMRLARPTHVWEVIRLHGPEYRRTIGNTIEVKRIGGRYAVARSELQAFADWYDAHIRRRPAFRPAL